MQDDERRIRGAAARRRSPEVDLRDGQADGRVTPTAEEVPEVRRDDVAAIRTAACSAVRRMSKGRNDLTSADYG